MFRTLSPQDCPRFLSIEPRRRKMTPSRDTDADLNSAGQEWEITPDHLRHRLTTYSTTESTTLNTTVVHDGLFSNGWCRSRETVCTAGRTSHEALDQSSRLRVEGAYVPTPAADYHPHPSLYGCGSDRLDAFWSRTALADEERASATMAVFWTPSELGSSSNQYRVLGCLSFDGDLICFRFVPKRRKGTACRILRESNGCPCPSPISGDR
jgi:hypothetical protein